MRFKLVIVLLIGFLPELLFAHGSHGSGIVAGFTHPIFGLDHAIAILGTGMLGYLLDSSRAYLYVLSFLAAMIIGGYLGIENEASFWIEKFISFSVLVIGMLVAFYSNLKYKILFFILALFGFVHGFAHGAEMPEATTAVEYIAGFSLGTLLLGGIGILICKLIQSLHNSTQLNYILGGVVMGCGIMLLI